MNKTQVYDLPTRLFHLIFALLFVCIFAIAKLTDDEAPLFSQHMLLGLVLGFLTLLRIVWGFVGTKYARFSSFPLHPSRLVDYLQSVLRGNSNRELGHNPASAWAALVMISLALCLGATGILMVTGHRETYKEFHELLSYAFVIVAVAHVAGVVLHQLRHHDGIALSMIQGKKEPVGSDTGIRHTSRLAATGMAALITLFAFHLYRNYDATKSTTRIFSVNLQLGKNPSGEHRGESKGARHEND